jgi:hypothetical protein
LPGGGSAGPEDVEAGALVGGGFDLDVAAVAGEDLADGPEAHAVAGGSLGGDAELEDAGEDVGADAGAFVGDENLDGVGEAIEGDGDAGSGGGDGFAGVADDIEEDLAGFTGETFDDAVTRDVDVEVDVLFADEGIEEEAKGVECGADVDLLELIALADEGEGGLGDVEDAAGFFGGGAGEGGDFGEDVGGGEDEVLEVLDGFEGAADLVADGGGHAGPVLDFLGGDEAFLHLEALGFGAAEAVGVVVDAEGDGGGAANEHDRNVGGEGGGDDVDRGVDPEDGDPGGDDFEEVGGAAGDDEEREADDEPGPVAGDDAAGAAGEIDERAADAEVAEEGDHVGDHHGPDKPRGRGPADGVRHERDGVHRELLSYWESLGSPMKRCAAVTRRVLMVITYFPGWTREFCLALDGGVGVPLMGQLIGMRDCHGAQKIFRMLA